PGIRAERAEGRAQGEAHAQAADQDPGARPPGDALAGEGGKRLLRAADAAVHEIAGAEPDGKFATAAHEAQVAAVGRGGGGDVDPRLHHKSPCERPPRGHAPSLPCRGTTVTRHADQKIQAIISHEMTKKPPK